MARTESCNRSRKSPQPRSDGRDLRDAGRRHQQVLAHARRVRAGHPGWVEVDGVAIHPVHQRERLRPQRRESVLVHQPQDLPGAAAQGSAQGAGLGPVGDLAGVAGGVTVGVGDVEVQVLGGHGELPEGIVGEQLPEGLANGQGLVVAQAQVGDVGVIRPAVDQVAHRRRLVARQVLQRQGLAHQFSRGEGVRQRRGVPEPRREVGERAIEDGSLGFRMVEGFVAEN